MYEKMNIYEKETQPILAIRNTQTI